MLRALVALIVFITQWTASVGVLVLLVVVYDFSEILGYGAAVIVTITVVYFDLHFIKPWLNRRYEDQSRDKAEPIQRKG